MTRDQREILVPEGEGEGEGDTTLIFIRSSLIIFYNNTVIIFSSLLNCRTID